MHSEIQTLQLSNKDGSFFSFFFFFFSTFLAATHQN